MTNELNNQAAAEMAKAEANVDRCAVRYIDSHCHYDDEAFKGTTKTYRDELLEQIHAAGVVAAINCASDLKTCESTLKLIQKHKWMYGAMGVHPHEVKHLDEDAASAIWEYADAHPRVCAIGEIGLDYHYDLSPRDLQVDWFIEQIELAKELELPIIVHSRDAAQETFDIISEYDAAEVGGVIHSYSGNVEMAKEYVKMGFCLGIGGMVTFPNTKKLLKVVQEIPLESLLLETDCPYLTPVPHRGERNDSRNIVFTAEKIAELKNVDVQTVYDVTTENAVRVFGIKL